MTVSQAVPIVEYTGNGVSTAFPFDFRIFKRADLLVTVDGVENTTYVLAITPQPAFGGTVTITPAPAAAAAIVIKRILPFSRSTDYQNGGDLPEGTLDDDQDAAVMMIQQLAAGVEIRIGSVLRVPDSEAVTALPAAGSRANRVLGFDANGDPVLVVGITGGAANVDLGYTPAADQGTVTNTGGADAVIPEFNEDDAGLVPAPGSLTSTRFLRDDGVWQEQVPPENPLVQYSFIGEYKGPLGGNGWLTAYNGVGASAVAGSAGTSPFSNTDPTRAQPYANRDTAVGNTNTGNMATAGAGSFQAAQIGDATIETGFRYQVTGGLSNQHQTDTGFFMGLHDFTAIASFNSVNPSTISANMIGVCLDATDTNVHLLSRNSSGGVTKINLGVARAADLLLSLVINREPRQNGCTVTVYNINSFTSPTLLYSGTPANLPLQSALLGHALIARQPGVAAGSTGVKCVRWLLSIKPSSALIAGWQ